jgi:hypothetical protein
MICVREQALAPTNKELMQLYTIMARMPCTSRTFHDLNGPKLIRRCIRLAQKEHANFEWSTARVQFFPTGADTKAFFLEHKASSSAMHPCAPILVFNFGASWNVNYEFEGLPVLQNMTLSHDSMLVVEVENKNWVTNSMFNLAPSQEWRMTIVLMAYLPDMSGLSEEEEWHIAALLGLRQPPHYLGIEPILIE